MYVKSATTRKIRKNSISSDARLRFKQTPYLPIDTQNIPATKIKIKPITYAIVADSVVTPNAEMSTLLTINTPRNRHIPPIIQNKRSFDDVIEIFGKADLLS
jgi:hypothetical protein